MANMTFKASLLPNTNLGYSLGSNDKQWNIYGELNGNASSADKWKNTRTLTIGNKSQNIDGSSDISYSLHDINYTNIAIGTATSWNYTTPGVYGVASSAAFTGEGHPESNNGGLTPYRYGQLLVYQASSYGISQFYISHHDSSSSYYGIKYRTGWNSNYESTWSTLLDSTNYTQYTVTKTGSGANGTWGINISGSATTLKDRTNNTLTYSNYGAAGLAASAITWLTCWNGYELRAISKAEMANAVDSSHKWVRLSGDTMTGNLLRTADSVGSNWVGSRDKAVVGINASDSSSSVAYSLCRIKFPSKTFAISSERANPQFGIYGWNNSRTENGYDWAFYLANNGYFYANTRIYGAVWNDYAEKRNIPEAQETDWKDEECAAHPYAGRCVKENGDDTMSFSTERLQKGCKIISDTFGYCVGETDDCKTPIAVSGRVLAYLLEDRETAKEHIGDFVCSGPNGTVSIMTTEEYFKCPQAVVGTISAIPDYEEWGTGHVKVDGRIWIYVR